MAGLEQYGRIDQGMELWDGRRCVMYDVWIGGDSTDGVLVAMSDVETKGTDCVGRHHVRRVEGIDMSDENGATVPMTMRSALRCECGTE
jgi:hypothetical protein